VAMSRWVVSYDIQKNKNRRRIQKEFERFGFLVQKSVGEAELSDAEAKKLAAILSCYVRPWKKESIRFFRVCEACWKESIFLGKKMMEQGSGDIFVI